METELISKKDLLDLTGISYGQLYRWKRKGLIPEDWFTRKSTFTGQETFFPKDKILARIARIKDMKEDLSLDDLADIFSPNLAEVILTKDQILGRGIVSCMTMDIFVEQNGDSGEFGFAEIFHMYVAEKLLQSGGISLNEAKIVMQALREHYGTFEGRNCDLIFIRKLGISTCCLVSSPSDVYFENTARVVSRLNLANCIEELKLKVS